MKFHGSRRMRLLSFIAFLSLLFFRARASPELKPFPIPTFICVSIITDPRWERCPAEHTWKALRRVNTMWNTALLPWNTVARPKPQVSPKSGVRTPMLLVIWNRLLFSCLLGLSPMEGLRILVTTTTVMVMFTTTMTRAGMTKASRALVSSQLSQHAFFLV